MYIAISSSSPMNYLRHVKHLNQQTGLNTINIMGQQYVNSLILRLADFVLKMANCFLLPYCCYICKLQTVNYRGL